VDERSSRTAGGTTTVPSQRPAPRADAPTSPAARAAERADADRRCVAAVVRTAAQARAICAAG